MNKVILSGRLTRDPEVRYANSGTTTARFSVACDRRFKSEGQPTADFINCVAFGKTAEFIEKYFTKGSGIELEGRIQTGSYDNQEGKKVYTTDVYVENVEFPKGSSNSNNNAKNDSSKPAADDFVNVPDSDLDELPFN